MKIENKGNLRNKRITVTFINRNLAKLVDYIINPHYKDIFLLTVLDSSIQYVRLTHSCSRHLFIWLFSFWPFLHKSIHSNAPRLLSWPEPVESFRMMKEGSFCYETATLALVFVKVLQIHYSALIVAFFLRFLCRMNFIFIVLEDSPAAELHITALENRYKKFYTEYFLTHNL